MEKTPPPARPETTEPAPDAPTARPTLKAPDPATRFLAKVIDGVVAALLFVLAGWIVPGAVAGALVGALLAGTYWIVCDGLPWEPVRHRSIGKWLIGIRVVRLGNRPMNVETSARRNWMFAAAGFIAPAGPILTMVLMLIVIIIMIYEVYKLLSTSDGMRRGDEWAGTRVVTAASRPKG